MKQSVMPFAFVLLVLCSIANAADDERAHRDPLLGRVEQAVRAALADRDPAPVFEYPEHSRSLIVKFRTRNFMIHFGSKTGRYSEKIHETEGPSYQGLLLRIHVQDAGTVNQAAVPQTIRQPYWWTDLGITVVPNTGKQLYWSFCYGGRTEKQLLLAVKETLDKLKALDDEATKPLVGTEPPHEYTGTYVKFHENGKKAFEGSYRQGVRHDSWRHWYLNGQIQLQGTYKEGESNGTWTWWREGGIRSLEAEYRNGRFHGKRTQWDVTGTIISCTHYVDGKIVLLERYEGGQLVGKGPPPSYQEHALVVTKKVAPIKSGMTRRDVEKILRTQDGGISGPTSTRYYEGWEVMVEVPYDEHGGAWNPKNRVTGPPHIYPSPRYLD